LRDSSFGPEWLAVTIWLVAILLVNRFVLVLVLVPRPDLKLSLIELGLTVLAYPIVVLVTHLLMGVRKATPGDFDSTGSRA
jgi:rod shape-determining protein MreD